MPDSETHGRPPALDFEEFTDAFRGCRRSELVGQVVHSAVSAGSDDSALAEHSACHGQPLSFSASSGLRRGDGSGLRPNRTFAGKIEFGTPQDRFDQAYRRDRSPATKALSSARPLGLLNRLLSLESLHELLNIPMAAAFGRGYWLPAATGSMWSAPTASEETLPRSSCAGTTSERCSSASGRSCSSPPPMRSATGLSH
jgi:hypothetical protein